MPFTFIQEPRSPSPGIRTWPSSSADISISQLSRADILRFLADLHRDDSPQMLTAVASFRFVPLEREKLYLVADVDASGDNEMFGTLDIVHCGGGTCIEGSELTADEHLDTDLVDVIGDGIFQIITKESLGSHSRSTFGTPPFVYSIRALVSGELVDVSAKYPDYFKDHIVPKMEADRKKVEVEIRDIDASLAADLKDLDGGNRRAPDQEESASKKAQLQCLKLMKSAELEYVQDDYHRRILGEKSAGLRNALNWVKSNDEDLKGFGIKALEVIDSSVAAAELFRISNSEDVFAEDARYALLQRAKANLAPPLNRIDRQ